MFSNSLNLFLFLFSYWNYRAVIESRQISVDYLMFDFDSLTQDNSNSIA